MKKEFIVELDHSVPICFSVWRAQGFDVFCNANEIVMTMTFRPQLDGEVALRERRVVTEDPMFMLTFANGELLRLTVQSCTDRLVMPFSPQVEYQREDDTAYLWFVKVKKRIVRRERVIDQRHCQAVITFFYNATAHLIGIEVVGASNVFSNEFFIEKADEI